MELEIRDDEGKELPPLETGEIVDKVGSVMKEYYREQKLTAQTVKNG